MTTIKLRSSLRERGVWDVIIVGAGVSGLHSAYLLQKAGLSALVLEARDRVGGKILTTDRVKGTSIRQEYGAAWINDSTQGHIWKVAAELGLTPMIQVSEGRVVAQDLDGRCLEFAYGEAPMYPSEIDTKRCLAFRDHIENVTTRTDGPLQSPEQRQELDSISFEAYIHKYTDGNARAKATATVWTHAMIGCDPGEVSALFFLDYVRAGGGLMQIRSDKKDGGQYMRIKEGTSAIPERMAQRLATGTLKLESPVKKIEEISELGLRRVTTAGTFGPTSYLAKRVILSVPSPMYRTITFFPPLSSGKRAYTDSTRYASYIKYLPVFKKPFWRENGYCGLAQSFVGPVAATRDTSFEYPDGRHYGFTCFIAGSFARKWSGMSQASKQAAVLQQLSQLFASGNDISDLLVDALESSWMTEEYSGWGCPIPIMSPGVFGSYWDAFVQPENGLHFVGNETSTVWRGYMDGAIRSAERGVAEVVAELKPGKALL